MKKLILFFFCFLLSLSAYSMSVTLAWDASSSSNVISYGIYYGCVSRTYTNRTEVGNVTNYTITNLSSTATYYFSATAINDIGLESDYSNEVQYPPQGSTNVVRVMNGLRIIRQ